MTAWKWYGPVAVYLVVLACALLTSTEPAWAPSCTVTVNTIDFGSTVDVLPGTAIAVTGSYALSCTGFGHNEIDRYCLNIGAGADVSGSQREMKSGTNILNFALYQDSAHTNLWGAWQQSVFETAGMQVDVTSDSSGNSSFSEPIYALIAAGQQTAATGSYTDTFPNSNVGAYATFAKQAGPSCPTGGGHAQIGFTVQGTVIPNCYLSATALNFGTASFITTAINATNTITVQCTNGLPYNIGLNAGSTTGGTTTTRLMASGANTVSYKMYSDSGHTTNWGNTVGTDTVSGTGTAGNQTLTVYGQVPIQSSSTPASYSDTVTITATF